MNAPLVQNWNSVVQPSDTVWVLGDVDMHDKDATLAPIDQLIGTKNHAGDSHGEDRYAQFRLRDEGIPLLHGHVKESFRERRTKQGTWCINVGVDWWGYAPVSAETLAHHLEELRRGQVTPISGTDASR